MTGTFYLFLAVLASWPAAIHPRSVLLGHPGNDSWNHVWGFWWVASEVLEHGRWPSWTRLIAWPDGGSLYFIDTFNALASLPFQVLFGPVATHNLVIVGSLWMTALAGWLLARHVVQDDAAALPAGVVFGFSPHLLAQAHNGITETLNAGWFALYVLALLRLLDRPGIPRGLAAAAALVACGLFNWYYGLFAGLATVIFLAFRILRTPWPTAWGRAAKATLVGGAVFGPLGLAGLWALQRSMDAPDALVNRDPEFVWRSLLYHNMSDLVSFFRPGRHYSPDLAALYGEDLIIVTYLGWLALGLAVWAAVRVRPWRELLPWVLVALVFWVFSLGPYLFVGGDYAEVAGRRVPLPFLAFFSAFPLFARISHPFRLVVGTGLALAVLAAVGLRHLLRGTARRKAWMVATAVAGAIFVEVWFASPAVLPLPHARLDIPEAYTRIRDDARPGAVLDLPMAVPILERAVYNWYQVHHGRPIPYTLNEPMPPGLRENLFARFLLSLEGGRARLLPRVVPDLELVSSTRILAREGYRWVVVHDPLYPEFKRRQVHALLSALFGPPVDGADGRVTVYEVP